MHVQLARVRVVSTRAMWSWKSKNSQPESNPWLSSVCSYIGLRTCGHEEDDSLQGPHAPSLHDEDGESPWPDLASRARSASLHV